MTLPIALVLSEWFDNCPNQVFNDRKKSWSECQPLNIHPGFRNKQRDQKFNGYRNYNKNYAANNDRSKKINKREKYKNPKSNNRYVGETKTQKQPPASIRKKPQSSSYNKIELNPNQYKPNISYPKPCRQFSDDFSVPPPNFVKPENEFSQEDYLENVTKALPRDQEPYLEEIASKTGFLTETQTSTALLDEITKTNEKLKLLTNGYSLDTICPFKYFSQEQFAEELVIHRTLHASRVAYLTEIREEKEEKEEKVETGKLLAVDQIPLSSDLLEKALKSKLSANAVPFTFKPQAFGKNQNSNVKMDVMTFLEFVSRIEDDTSVTTIENFE